MATHAQTQHDYSPPRIAAPGTQKHQGIVAGLTLPSLHSPQEMLLDCTSAVFKCAHTHRATLTLILAHGQKDTETDTQALTLTADRTQCTSIALSPLAIQGPNDLPPSLIDVISVPFMCLPVH